MLSMQALFNLLLLGDARDQVAPTQKEEGEETSSSSPKQITHSTKTVEYTLVFVKCMTNKRACIHAFSIPL